MRNTPDDVDEATVDRFLFEARRGFDAVAPTADGDAARIERLARAVSKRRAARMQPPASRRRLVVAAGVVLLLGAGVATAAFWTTQRPDRGPQTEHVTTPTVGQGRTFTTPPVHVTPTVSTAAGDSPCAGVARGPRAKPSRSTGRGNVALALAPPPAILPEPTALELFTAGNRARTAGDTDGAITAYETLQSRFAPSPEATASRISLGMLYLERGRPRFALEQFRAFRRSGAGATTSEAYWGEAQALRALGEAEQETRIVEELLRHFPDSAYAGAASGRLSQLKARP